MSSPRFSPKAMTFLRSLKRNNDREWFIVESPAFRRTAGTLDGERLQRVPNGLSRSAYRGGHYVRSGCRGGVSYVVSGFSRTVVRIVTAMSN